VNRHEIDADRDELLLLGSDGLWDFLSNEEAIEIAAGALTAGRGPEGACDALIEEVLRKAAKNCGLSVEELKNLPAGSDRRRKHDDITCICIDLSEVAIQSYEAEP
jgi:pyruvate dehydrogenase phosphatase